MLPLTVVKQQFFLHIPTLFQIANSPMNDFCFVDIYAGQAMLLLMIMLASSTDGFKIDVHYGRETFPVDVKGTDTLATLKERIEHIEQFGNIPHKKQILIRWDIVLENDSKTVDEYNIKKDEEIGVSWYEFQISLKYEEKEPFKVQVKYNDTVKFLKEKIQEKFGIPLEKQKVIYSCEKQYIVDEPCDDSQLIYNLNVAKDATISVFDGFKIHLVFCYQNQSLSLAFVYVKGTARTLWK
ncbi:hypothetical protein niasHT_006188 [Heterodera trifolii]|uniref:Ubiquitin-like domain-containing protein n=1 Tax=Heterodera trifolii TaxID=157864 RepID=A0ABD2M2E0_9BILA